MSVNQKLTGVIGGRRIRSTDVRDGEWIATFDDGSTMTVRCAGGAPDAASGTVDQVIQSGTTLTLKMRSGESVAVPLAEATSCVLVRSASRHLEYAD